MQKTKDELLVENAVLKYNEQVRAMLKEELSPLRKEVENMDRRLKVVEETLQPFTSFRRKLWRNLIYFVLGAGIALLTYYEVSRR